MFLYKVGDLTPEQLWVPLDVAMSLVQPHMAILGLRRIVADYLLDPDCHRCVDLNVKPQEDLGQEQEPGRIIGELARCWDKAKRHRSSREKAK